MTTPVHVLTYWEDGSRSKAIVARTRRGLEYVFRKVIEREKGDIRILSYHVGYEVEEPEFVVKLQEEAERRNDLMNFQWTIGYHLKYLLEHGGAVPPYVKICQMNPRSDYELYHEHTCACGGAGYTLVGKTLGELYDAHEAARDRARA